MSKIETTRERSERMNEQGASREASLSSREIAVTTREHAVLDREEAARLQEETLRALEEAARARSEVDALLLQVQEANEHLVVASLRAQTLAEAAEYLAAIVASSDDAIISKTLDGIITSWNRAAERIFGYTAAEAVGQPITLITPEDRRAEEKGVLDRLRQGERIEHFETERQAKDGRTISISLTVSPVRNDLGDIVGASKVARDITEQRRMQKALREADRRKDEFLTTVAHELRNPVNALRLQLLGVLRAAQRTRKPLPRTWVVDRITQATDDAGRLHRLLENLLDVSRISEGQLRLELEDVDLSRVVHVVVERFRQRLKGDKVTVDVTPASGRWDRLRLEQVVTNLLSNAIAYGERKPIEISVKADRESAWLSVRDHGVGIHADDQPRLFTRFERAAANRHPGGFGLGLWISKELVHAMGGRISVESRPGHGSTFSVVLPRGIA